MLLFSRILCLMKCSPSLALTYLPWDWCRWTFSARIKALPLGQKLTFTGTSTYAVSMGLLVSQKDVWDAVGNNEFLSVCSVGFCLESMHASIGCDCC